MHLCKCDHNESGRKQWWVKRGAGVWNEEGKKIKKQGDGDDDVDYDREGVTRG